MKLWNHLIVIATLTLLSCSSAWPSSIRPAAFISDLHVGAGKKADGSWREIEDFRWQADFDLFLSEVSKRSGEKLDLVLAGDIFELWQSPTMICSNAAGAPSCKVTDCMSGDKDLGCNEKDAIARLDYILKQHPDFITSLRTFATKGSNHVYLVPGNHDAALLLPGVAALLKKQFEGTRVTLLSEGFWLSPDGLVYSDHGHQSDQVNLFEKWPVPFSTRDGVTFLRKSWGENMAQQFYNQYEVIFPIIDNLSDEATGARYAIRQAGGGATAGAVSNFIKFILIEESITQASRLLGDGTVKVRYDYAAVRAKPLSFFVDGLDGKSDVQIALANTPAAFSTSPPDFDLTQAEIDSICLAKYHRGDPNKCPEITEVLSAIAYGALLSPEEIKAEYLRDVLPMMRERSKKYFSLYVAGHSHIADNPKVALSLGDLAFGNTSVDYLNTGAFQRVASPDQLSKILGEPKHAGKRPLDLQPEDLPACYNYVWVAPYAAKPTGTLHAWAKSATGVFKTFDGQCLMR